MALISKLMMSLSLTLSFLTLRRIQILLEVTHAAREAIDAFQATDDTPPVCRTLGRNPARVNPGLSYITRHERVARDGHIVANAQMPSDPGTTTDATTRADVRTARKTCATR
jgi:hypothetical protein